MRNPAGHEAHERSLANRLIDQAIREWIDVQLNIALAFTPMNDREHGAKAAIEQVRNLDLAGYRHQLTPKILDELRRAGLLVTDTKASPSGGEGDA